MTWDDDIAKMIRVVLVEHRAILETMISRVRNGEPMTAVQLTRIADVIGTSSNGSDSSMMKLNILSTFYLTLQNFKAERPDGTPKPETETSPANRPVRDFVRKIFNK
jgi:hypothetical protein